MNADELRALQAPIKATYREDPAAALVVQRARGRVSQATLTCALETGKPGAPSGLHPAAGGDGSHACSGDMLLEALVGCAGVTLAAVSTSMGIALTNAFVTAEGDLDFRGTLGVSRDVPVGFRAIRLKFQLETDAPKEKLAKLVELTERYCVVAQTIKAGVAIETILE